MGSFGGCAYGCKKGGAENQELPIADWIADCRLPIADCRLPIADCRLPIADSTATAFAVKFGKSHYTHLPKYPRRSVARVYVGFPPLLRSGEATEKGGTIPTSIVVFRFG